MQKVIEKNNQDIAGLKKEVSEISSVRDSLKNSLDTERVEKEVLKKGLDES